jgi:cytochrome c oxidase subunit 2
VSKRAIGGTILAALIATGIGIALSYAIHWFPVQASTQAKESDTLYHVLVIASVPIFVLVVTTILFSVYHFRVRPGQELQDGPPIHGNTRLEVLWTAIPALLLLGLVAYSFVVLRDNEKAPADGQEIRVNVTGQQFAWSYSYPSSVTGGAPLYTTQLYVPENESVYFAIHSKPSGSRPSACRSTPSRGSRRTTAPPPTGSGPTPSSATCCAASGMG